MRHHGEFGTFVVFPSSAPGLGSHLTWRGRLVTCSAPRLGTRLQHRRADAVTDMYLHVGTCMYACVSGNSLTQSSVVLSVAWLIEFRRRRYMHVLKLHHPLSRQLKQWPKATGGVIERREQRLLVSRNEALACRRRSTIALMLPTCSSSQAPGSRLQL